MAVSSKHIPAPDLYRVRRALISVSDKTGLIEFAKALHAHGVEILSTGGTAKSIAAENIPIRDVSEVTGFPEIMDGRVKTLHPSVHGGLLAVRNDPEHVAAMEEHGIGGIDLVVINLYPVEEVRFKVSDNDTTVENIDISGTAMIRVSEKNNAYVATVVDSAVYADVVAQLEQNAGSLPLSFRKKLAA